MEAQTVFNELTLGCQQRYNGLRRRLQFFSTFAGGVIEALRESGFRLCNFEKSQPFNRFGPATSQLAQAQQLARAQQLAQGGDGMQVDNIELFFEQRDRDQCKVIIIPYRTDLPFLYKDKFLAQLGLELSRYSSDPDVLRQALNVNTNASFGSFLGGNRLPKLYLHSGRDLKPPGTMTFELKGARLVVSMNVVWNLAKYRQSDFDLDIDAIRLDFEALFYGLEKYLSLLLKNFGSDIVVEQESDSSAPTEQAPPGPAEPSAETLE